jgi:hypothetical protein
MRAHLNRYRFWQRWVIEENAATVAGDLAGLAALLEGSASARRLLL